MTVPLGYRVEVMPVPPVEVGAVFTLEVRVEHPEGVELPAPVLASGEAFRLREVATETGPEWTVHQLELVAVAPPGEHELAPIRLGEELATEPFAIEVVSGMAADSGQQAEIHDIRGPYLIELPPRYGLLALMVLGGLALAGFGWYLWRRRRARVVPAPPPPEPALEADLALARLAQSGLLEAGDIEGFLEQLSGIVKRYAGRRFATGWRERTSAELSRDLDARLESEHLRLLGGILDHADRAKFSERRFRPDLARECLERARSFVDRTRPPVSAEPDPA